MELELEAPSIDSSWLTQPASTRARAWNMVTDEQNCNCERKARAELFIGVISISSCIE